VEDAVKILIVEDSDSYIKTARRLATHLGHQLVVATNGAEGYALAHDHPNLILMDINLPDTDGLSLTQKLRAEHLTVPIVAVTGDLLTYSRELALQAGCDDFIEKPFTLDTLEQLFCRYSA
jgi:CheY-like chemotaxis protein